MFTSSVLFFTFFLVIFVSKMYLNSLLDSFSGHQIALVSLKISGGFAREIGTYATHASLAGETNKEEILATSLQRPHGPYNRMHHYHIFKFLKLSIVNRIKE